MINDVLELYARCGRSLSEYGLSDAVLPFTEGVHALDLFSENGWRVLGGDVYKCNQSGVMENFYADWFCNSADYLESIDYAKEHLSKLANDDLFISFTIKSS